MLAQPSVGGSPSEADRLRLATAHIQRVFSDPSPLVSRRLGFATLPLACLVIRVMMQALGMASRRSDDDPSSAAAALFDDAGASAFWHSDGVKWAGIVLGGTAGWVCIVAFKIILGINLLNFATRRCAGMEARLHEDEELNRLARSPLGEAEGERVRRPCFNFRALRAWR